MTIVNRVLDVHRLFVEAGQPHAFGGALALAYVIEPRGTIDVDVNVFLPFERANEVATLLTTLGLTPTLPIADVNPIAGIRFVHLTDPVPVDVFLSVDERYRETQNRVRHHPFGPDATILPFLLPEDLTVFKLSIGRDKDWVDLRQIAAAEPNLNLEYVEEQLLTLRGPSMHPRLARFRSFR